MASPAITLVGRYRLDGKPIGQGGMGLVYRAYDIVTRRNVAVKTMRGPLNRIALDLFAKEWSVLAQISHPNIVDVLDTGELEEDGERRPFFVMPFLPGANLEQLLQNASPRLTPERVISIVVQTCRGLQAAHEHGLIHRDLKPSNIFVLDDDAVKIIDFGVVHLAGADSATTIKGTLQYMAPEQIDLQPCTPASDIYSLGVVCYEALTGRKPFARKTEAETAEAIRRYIPPPISDLNPLVSQVVTRVIHKAMAKDPWHRFSSARDFSGALQKALQGENINGFDAGKIQARIERARKAYTEADHQFASEILRELEAEGNVDPEIGMLRSQIDQAMRQKSIRQLLESARTRLEEDEFPLALQKIQEALALDPGNADAASLRIEIEKRMSQRQTENWFHLVDQHIRNRSFGQARQGLQEILKLNANDARARDLLVEVDRREKEIERLREEKEQLYKAALSCYQRGEISSAITKLERILEVTRRSPDSALAEREAQYQNLYNQARNEREAQRSAYAEARRCLADRNFAKALEMCSEFLKKSPGDPMFQALKLEAEEQARQEQSAFIAEVSRRVEAEKDLDRRVNILQEAVNRYPEEPHLEHSLRLVRERRDLVNAIVAKARQYEEGGQFTEALGQFEILRNIYGQYPGLEFETERLKRRRDDQMREEAKGKWVEQLDRHIASGDYARARDLARTALSEFPDDRELAGLERFAEAALKRAAEAEEWLQRGQQLCFDRQFAEGLAALEKATALDNRNPVIRSALLNALVEHARSVLGQDWRAAEPLVRQALALDATHPVARSLQGLIADYQRQEAVSDCISKARELQGEGNLSGALAAVEACQATYPNELRLAQLRQTLQSLGAVSPGGPKTPFEAPRASSPTPVESAPDIPAPASEARHPGVTEFFTIDRSIAEGAAPPAASARPAPSRQPEPDKRKPAGAWFFTLRETAVAKAARLRSALKNWNTAPNRRSLPQWGIVALAVIILGAGLAKWVSLRIHRAPPTQQVVEFPVGLDANVPNAKFIVDNQPVSAIPVKLKAGPHTLEAAALGYKPANQPFTVQGGAAKPLIVSLTLEPEPIRLRLISDLKNAKVTLDGQPADLSDGGFADDSVTVSSQHTLSLSQGGKEVLSLSFSAEPGRMAILSGPITAKDLKVAAVAQLGPEARIYASDPSLRAGIAGEATQPIPTEGLPISAPGGNAEFVLDDGKSQQPLAVEFGNAPGFTIWLASDPNLGTLDVEANVPDADVFIDGAKRQPLRSGRSFLRLEPGIYNVWVVKDGYEQALEQRVELKKGAKQTARFELRALPKLAYLAIEGGTPDAEVLIDGTAVGKLGADGSYKKEDVPPASHTIGLRKQNFEPKQLARTFTASQTERIAGADAQLTPYGAIEFRLTPLSATVMYQRTDEAQPRTGENGKSLSLRPGRYAIQASAAGYLSHQDLIDVEPGKTRQVDWALAVVKTEVPHAPPPPPTLTKDYFTDPDSWKEQGGWWVHHGEETSWLKSNQGVYTIEMLRQSAKLGPIKLARQVRWTIDQNENGDRIEYKFDFGSLEREVFVGGKVVAKSKTPVPGKSLDSFTLQIEISPRRIVVRGQLGRDLDLWDRQNPAPLGKFGFRGDVALKVKRGE
jgi:eukaryotic-like serine/threonine-protein kinase